MGTTAQLFGLMTAPGAVVTALGRGSRVRRLFGSCWRSWMSGASFAAAAVLVCWFVEATVIEPNEWQFFFTVILAMGAVMVWGVAALVVAATTWLRHRFPVVDAVVNGLLIAVTLASVLLCIVFLATLPSALS